jgi:hypothetical protein
VIIAGMPIATAASAKTRPSIMIFPVTCKLDASDRKHQEPFADQRLPRACFRRIAPRIFWFRGLWQKPGQRFAVCGRNSTKALEYRNRSPERSNNQTVPISVTTTASSRFGG